MPTLAVVNVSLGATRRSNGNTSVSYMSWIPLCHVQDVSMRFMMPGTSFIATKPSPVVTFRWYTAGSSTRPLTNISRGCTP